jgi:hypothetical protein
MDVMKPLFNSYFCPNDCDRPKAAKSESWRDELMKRIKPVSRKVILEAGWLECPHWVLTYSQPHTYSFYPEVDVKMGRYVDQDAMRRADWVVAIHEGVVTVIKNRYGACDLAGLPVYE